MPYKSDKQRKYMHWAAEKGKIDPEVVEEFDAEERSRNRKSSRKFKRLNRYLGGKEDA
jgi:hypothetical protein